MANGIIECTYCKNDADYKCDGCGYHICRFHSNCNSTRWVLHNLCRGCFNEWENMKKAEVKRLATTERGE